MTVPAVGAYQLAGDGRPGATTALVITVDQDQLPALAWVGVAHSGLSAVQVSTAVGPPSYPRSAQSPTGRGIPLLPQTADAWLGRPGLSGHRLGSRPAGGRDWSSSFHTAHIDASQERIRIEAIDPTSHLRLEVDAEALPGGAVRLRHRVTNDGDQPYVVDALDVTVPVADRVSDQLDMTGRWGRERQPQRATISDGVWLRETRGGRSGPDSPTLLTAGTSDFGFRRGEVWGIHVGWSGGTRHFVERQPSGLVTLGGGELLLPGEIVLAGGETYSTPWIYVVASDHGLDGLAEQLHAFQRSLPAHPRGPKPVVANMWEAVYFDHNLHRIRELATLAAQVGVERFVLDDGWFGERRDDRRGLGDWVVSAAVWPDGLAPLVKIVHELGMDFGLWFEPEMVNPDSDLYRAHPDWVLATAGREPLLFRNQLVLDLGREEVRTYLFEQMDAMLSSYEIAYVKWDHNRNLFDASGSAGTPGVHAQTVGFYQLLDALRAAHPSVQWESCASGGGRIDLGVIERVERFWTSDATDALSRQQIQRWTGQLIAPEYLGAHVSAPVNHQTGRTLSLDLRAATAFFADFGVEWDLTRAGAAELHRLADWIAAYKRHRRLLHSGRIVRGDFAVPEVLIHGVISEDGREAVLAYVQMGEFVSDPPPFLIPGLDPFTPYVARSILPTVPLQSQHADEVWPGEGVTITGAALQAIGLPPPSRQPESAHLVHLSAHPGAANVVIDQESA